MKRIGLFLRAKPSGGGKYQYSLAMLEAVASLPKDEFQPVVIYTSDHWRAYLKDYDLPEKGLKIGVWVPALSQMWRSIGLPLSLWRKICILFHPVAKELIGQNCDLWIFPSQDAWSYQVPVPALGTIHDLMHRYERRFPEVSAHGKYKYREKHYRQMCKWVKGILVDSEVGKRQVIESYGTDPKKIHILPFVPPKYIYNDTPHGFDQNHQLPKKFILYPSQFWEHKNHKSLIKAVHILRDKYPDLNLVFVGSKKNGYESSCDMVQKLNLKKNILFVGYVPDRDIPEFYRRARAMVMPTFFGPTNIPPLEANALGCPVAVSNVYGMVEQLGDSALYFDPSSIDEIANVIEKIWTDDILCIELKKRGLIRSSQWNQVRFNERLYTIIRNILR